MKAKSKHGLKVFRISKRKAKVKKKEVFKAQIKTIFQYLQEHTATASMVAEATGIPQKNICRHKRDLEKKGMLWEVEKRLCNHTGFRAWYLTTNPEFINHKNQSNNE